jgi:hypothetical protein
MERYKNKSKMISSCKKMAGQFFHGKTDPKVHQAFTYFFSFGYPQGHKCHLVSLMLPTDNKSLLSASTQDYLAGVL